MSSIKFVAVVIKQLGKAIAEPLQVRRICMGRGYKV